MRRYKVRDAFYQEVGIETVEHETSSENISIVVYDVIHETVSETVSETVV